MFRRWLGTPRRHLWTKSFRNMTCFRVLTSHNISALLCFLRNLWPKGWILVSGHVSMSTMATCVSKWEVAMWASDWALMSPAQMKTRSSQLLRWLKSGMGQRKVDTWQRQGGTQAELGQDVKLNPTVPILARSHPHSRRNAMAPTFRANCAQNRIWWLRWSNQWNLHFQSPLLESSTPNISLSQKVQTEVLPSKPRHVTKC